MISRVPCPRRRTESPVECRLWERDRGDPPPAPHKWKNLALKGRPRVGECHSAPYRKMALKARVRQVGLGKGGSEDRSGEKGRCAEVLCIYLHNPPSIVFTTLYR